MIRSIKIPKPGLTHVTGTRLFYDVSQVLGAYRAFVELGKVNRALHEQFGRGLNFKVSVLSAAFIGDRMPQGGEFWRDVATKIEINRAKLMGNK